VTVWEQMRASRLLEKQARRLSEQREMAKALFAVWWGAQNDLPPVEKMVEGAWKDAGLALAKLDELDLAAAKPDAGTEAVRP